MGNISIISNNPRVLERYSQETLWAEGGVSEVYEAARDYIHRGARLLNHPLAGSVKPNQSPYRSLILSTAADLPVDLDSLSHIEGAIDTLRRLPKLSRQYTKDTLEDFQFLDFCLLETAVQALPAKYYLSRKGQ